jgi:transcription initiation factor TFIIB
MKISNPFEYDLAPYINQLELSPTTQERAEALLVTAEQAGLTLRRTRAGLIAAVLYIAGILEGERRTQKAIGQVTGVSPQTIQTRYRQLVQVLDIRRHD